MFLVVKTVEAKRLQSVETGLESKKWHGLLSVSPGRAFVKMYQINYEYVSYGNNLGSGLEYIYNEEFKMHGAGIYMNVYPFGTALEELFIGVIAGYNLMNEILTYYEDGLDSWYIRESYSGLFYGAYAGYRFAFGNFAVDLMAGVRVRNHLYADSRNYDYSGNTKPEVLFWPNINIGLLY